MAKGKKGIVCNTRSACQKHVTQHHGGAAIRAVLRDEQGLPEDGIDGIDEQNPESEAGPEAGPASPAGLTRPLGQAVIAALPLEVSGLYTDVTTCDLA